MPPAFSSQGLQGGSGRSPAFPNKLCQESGALPLGEGNKSQRSLFFPHRSFPWKGEPAGGSRWRGWGSSRCVTPTLQVTRGQRTGGQGPHGGPLTFPGSAQSRGLDPSDTPAPRLRGLGAPFPRACPGDPGRRPSPDGCPGRWGGCSPHSVGPPPLRGHPCG